jgi:tetratricopeptide (TPR) repeat protein
MTADVASAPTLAPTPAKRRMLVYGNCQAGWLAQALQRNVEVAGDYEIVYLSDYSQIPADHPIHQPDFISTCTDAVWQTASGCKKPDFLAGLRTDCRQIRFPTLWLKLLWPTYAVDPRNQPETEFPWGRYPYGDRLVMKLLAEGVTPEDLPKRYVETDLNRIVNLDRFAEMSLAELRFNDRQSDVAITPFIENTFRRRKLFGTVNHPTFLILDRIYHGVVGALLGNPVPENPAPPADAANVLGSEETPLHPQIITHFKLAWATAGMKWRYRSEFLALDEYLRAYAAWRPIPMGNPPQLWLARAQQAFALNDFPEAQRLLLEATAQFPALAHFLQYLGVLLVRQGNLLEAEKVLRYAIAKHPRVAGLYHDLGAVMMRRNFREEACRLFEETLRLDPNHKDARAHLAATTARL